MKVTLKLELINSVISESILYSADICEVSKMCRSLLDIDTAESKADKSYSPSQGMAPSGGRWAISRQKWSVCQMAVSAEDENGAGKENKEPGDVLF